MTDSASQSRSHDIDVVKGVMILLMVQFHSDSIGLVEYLNVRTITVGFFLPVFFFLSGYFTKKPASLGAGVLRTTARIVVPYFVFLFLYLLLIRVGDSLGYPIRNRQQLDTCGDWLYVLLVRPTGPYYYLYSLALYRLVFYLSHVVKADRNRRILLQFFLMLPFMASPLCTSYWWIMFAGTVWREYELDLPRSGFCALAIPAYVGGAMISNSRVSIDASEFVHFSQTDRVFWLVWTLSMMGFTRYLGRHVPNWTHQALAFTGRHTLSILVLHIFAIKGIALPARYLSFDPTGILYAVFVTLGSAFACVALELVSVRMTRAMIAFRASWPVNAPS